MIELVIPIIVVFGGLGVLSWYLVRKLQNFAIALVDEQKADLSRWINENLPKITESFGENVRLSLQKSIGGFISGDRRLEKGLAEAFTSDVVNQQSPLLGVALDLFPQVKGYLMKNPQAIQSILPMLQGFMKKKEGSETAW